MRLPGHRSIPALLLLPLLAGCGGYRASAPPPAVEPAPSEAARQTYSAAASAQLPSSERLLVRRAELELVAREPGELAPRVTEITRAAGGYVASSVASEGRVLRMSLRVPSPALDSVLSALSGLGEVERRQVSAQDVTDQVFDLEARLQNLRTVRDRLRQHLDRATAVGDIVAVERELARVQGEVEVLEGRLKRMREETSLSQVSLEVRQKRVLGPLGQVVSGAVWLISKLFVIR